MNRDSQNPSSALEGLGSLDLGAGSSGKLGAAGTTGHGRGEAA